MSIAENCSDCCPLCQNVASLLVDVVSASGYKCGFIDGDGKYYKSAEVSGTAYRVRYRSTDGTCSEGITSTSATAYYSGTVTYDSTCEAYTGAWIRTVDGEEFSGGTPSEFLNQPSAFWEENFLDWYPVNYEFSSPSLSSFTTGTASYTATLDESCYDYPSGDIRDSKLFGSNTVTFSDEQTTESLIADTEADLPDFSGDYVSPLIIGLLLWAYRHLSEDESTFEIRSTRYICKFRPQLQGARYCSRKTWVERFIPETGVSVDSLEVIWRGSGRPNVTIAAPPSGGTQAYAVAVMDSVGQVASIRILNPGSGYKSAPTVTIQAAINGGTTATGWTASLTEGRVFSISGGSAGNYLFTIGITGGGGTGAAATCTMDDQGGMASITLTSGGSGYSATPSPTVVPKVLNEFTPLIHIHLGTETARCAKFDGILPEGYDPEDPETWPSAPGYFEIPVPEDDGIVTINNELDFCDCSDCPEA